MPELHVKLITQERVLFDGAAESVMVPAANGYLGVLPKHAPLMAALGNGVLKISRGGKDEEVYYAVFGGFLQVKDDLVTVLADQAVAAAEIDPLQAREEVSRLQKALAEQAPGEQQRQLSHELEEARVRDQAARQAGGKPDF